MHGKLYRVSLVSSIQAGRQKIKCDYTRPCNQCRLRPPRAGVPCTYPDSGQQENEQTPAQMGETIKPYTGGCGYTNKLGCIGQWTWSAHGCRNTQSMPEASDSFGLPEPSSDIIANLLNLYGPIRRERAVPGSDCIPPVGVATTSLRRRGSPPYTQEAFLMCCLQNAAQDVHNIGPRDAAARDPAFTVLYAHGGTHPGEVSRSAAVSIALGAVLHLIGSARNHYSPLPVRASCVGCVRSCGQRPVLDSVRNEHGRRQSMTILFSVSGMKFLSGDDAEESSHPSLLVRSTILLERVIAVGRAQARVEARLDRFHATVSSGPSPRSLMLAIIRLHAAYAPILLLFKLSNRVSNLKFRNAGGLRGGLWPDEGRGKTNAETIMKADLGVTSSRIRIKAGIWAVIGRDFLRKRENDSLE
ncbi:hypothetical protein FB451DRAFT_1182521 [Mycena latifolia]|nr:hypothetical protein FB451DRAFT_1182521 [Mycena latifolia]